MRHHTEHISGTIVYFDVVKSSQIGHHGEAGWQILSRFKNHAERLADPDHHNAFYNNYKGDGSAPLLFHEPTSAVKFARDLFDYLQNQETSDDLPPVQVRMALHAGQITMIDGVPFGDAVWHGARLMSAANPDQILLSDAAATQIRQLSLPFRCECVPLDEYSVRDFQSPVLLFCLDLQGYNLSLAKPLIQGADTTNLPQFEREFVGREHECELLLRTFREERRRLVTITGIGGMGKTRLGCHVAEQLKAEFPDGVWYIEVSEWQQPEEIVSPVASVLPFINHSDVSTQTLLQTLSNRSLLLIFDCLRDVVPSSAWIAELLRAAPSVSCLVVSRRPLGLNNEIVYPLGVMGSTEEREGLQDSLALFEQEARAKNLQIAIGAAERAVISEIVTYLQGYPLSLIMAASRLRFMNLRQLRDEIQHNRAQWRDLEAILTGSFGLLQTEQRYFLQRLSVLSGYFRLEDACAICPTLSLIQMAEQLGDLSQLVEKRYEQDEYRYRLLDTIREFLKRTGETGDVPDDMEECCLRHAQHFCGLAKEIGEAAKQGASREAGKEMMRQLNNFREAVAFAMKHHHAALQEAFAVSLSRLLFEAGFWKDFEPLAKAAVCQTERAEIRIELYGLLGAWARRRKAEAEAQEFWLKRLEEARQAQSIDAEIDTLCDLARQSNELSRFREARNFLTQARQRARESRRPEMQVIIQTIQAEVALHENKLDKALREADSAKLKLRPEMSPDTWLCVHKIRGRIFLAQENGAEAESALREMIRLARDTNRRFGLAWALIELGKLYRCQHNIRLGAITLTASVLLNTAIQSHSQQEAQALLTEFQNAGGTRISNALAKIQGKSWEELVAELLNSDTRQ